MNAKNRLLQYRRQILSLMTGQAKVIRGTLVLMKRVCGNKRCRCSRGQKHESLYISQSRKGITRMVYIPRQDEAKVRQYTENYKRIKNLLNKISEINLKLLIKRAL